DEMQADLMRVDPTVARKRQQQLAALRERRDNAAVQESLRKIRAAAHTDENMMPLLIEAVEAYTTVGEICGILREEWGEYQEVLTI
ncbi:MAG: methylmalonyl-CoA mutase family protein, partial [Dehalococcoidia bacterium]